MIGIIVYFLLSVLLGSLVCFYGRHIYLPVLGTVICLFTLGFCLSFYGENIKALLVAAGICALVVVALKFVFKAGMFLAGSLLGAVLGQLLTVAFPQIPGSLGWAVILVPALVVGICSAKWSETFLAVSTAFSGAFMITAPAVFLILQFRNLSSFVYADGTFSTMIHLHEYLYHDFATQKPVILLAATLICAMIGCFIQLSTGIGAVKHEH